MANFCIESFTRVMRDLERAVQNRQPAAMRLAALELEQVLEDCGIETVLKAVAVIQVMGRVGDTDNAPKMLHYLRSTLSQPR